MIDRLSSTAVAAARAAGRIQLQYFGKQVQVIAAPQFDVTLEVDRRCQHAILQVITKAFPGHAIVAEESAPINPEAEYVWFVDPLDGTVNFFQGIWHFSTCIACYRNAPPSAAAHSLDGENGLCALGAPLVGVVYAPALDELYIGIPGRPPACNGRRIAPADPVDDLSHAVVCISFGKDEAAIRKMEKLNAKLVRRVRKVRMFGSTGLDIANVARGRISALIQCSVRQWDFAASRIVLEQSGGRFDARQTAPNRWEMLAACSDRIYHPLKEMTAAAWESD